MGLSKWQFPSSWSSKGGEVESKLNHTQLTDLPKVPIIYGDSRAAAYVLGGE